MLGLNPLAMLRQRLGAVAAAFLGAAACCVCGAYMAFVAAPGQALTAAGVSRLPVMDAAAVEAAAPGQAVLISGRLAGNAPLLEGMDFVAYSEEEWNVTVPPSDEDSSGEPHGDWKASRVVVPELSLSVGGQTVVVHSASVVRLSGPLREELLRGESTVQAKYESELLPDGSKRYRGLADGDLASVLGKKAAAGVGPTVVGVTPEQIFAGDRAAFEASQKQAASNLFVGGIASMIAAPVVGGVLGALFWRRRR
jgi:hypothetical protein